MRFGILLAACLALPLIAFALLRPHAYHGWRHFYFLHGPFCLLATFALMGWRQLPVRRLRKRWLVGAAGALMAAGLFVVVIEMAQIHPNQHLYFNFLADRKTPERLRTRYTMDYYSIARRQGYEYLLRQTPAAAIDIKGERFSLARSGWLGKMILPAADRRRFARDLSRAPDFYLSEDEFRGDPIPRLFQLKDPFLPVLHRFKVYNNTIMTVTTPDLSRVDPAMADRYRALLRAATAGEPVARGGGYEVYRRGQRLAWVKEACEPGALRRQFRLEFHPADADREHGYFTFVRGVWFDGKCLGAARLPDFAPPRVRLGQAGRWEVEVPF